MEEKADKSELGMVKDQTSGKMYEVRMSQINLQRNLVLPSTNIWYHYVGSSDRNYMTQFAGYVQIGEWWYYGSEHTITSNEVGKLTTIMMPIYKTKNPVTLEDAQVEVNVKAFNSSVYGVDGTKICIEVLGRVLNDNDDPWISLEIYNNSYNRNNGKNYRQCVRRGAYNIATKKLQFIVLSRYTYEGDTSTSDASYPFLYISKDRIMTYSNGYNKDTVSIEHRLLTDGDYAEATGSASTANNYESVIGAYNNRIWCINSNDINVVDCLTNSHYAISKPYHKYTYQNRNYLYGCRWDYSLHKTYLVRMDLSDVTGDSEKEIEIMIESADPDKGDDVQVIYAFSKDNYDYFYAYYSVSSSSYYNVFILKTDASFDRIIAKSNELYVYNNSISCVSTSAKYLISTTQTGYDSHMATYKLDYTGNPTNIIPLPYLTFLYDIKADNIIEVSNMNAYFPHDDRQSDTQPVLTWGIPYHKYPKPIEYQFCSKSDGNGVYNADVKVGTIYKEVE